jgi:hypothetical protein
MTIIPTRGTVKFYAYAFDDDAGELDLVITGHPEWQRPAVALIITDPIETREETGIVHDIIVVDEVGELFRHHDYLESLMGDWHWDHVMSFFQPHIDGPVTDAPKFQRLEKLGEGEPA